MRRKEREIIDFEKMVHFPDRCDCCRLGLTDGETPYIVPLNFGRIIENGLLTLYFHCAALFCIVYENPFSRRRRAPVRAAASTAVTSFKVCGAVGNGKSRTGSVTRAIPKKESL